LFSPVVFFHRPQGTRRLPSSFFPFGLATTPVPESLHLLVNFGSPLETAQPLYIFEPTPTPLFGGGDVLIPCPVFILPRRIVLRVFPPLNPLSSYLPRGLVSFPYKKPRPCVFAPQTLFFVPPSSVSEADVVCFFSPHLPPPGIDTCLGFYPTAMLFGPFEHPTGNTLFYFRKGEWDPTPFAVLGAFRLWLTQNDQVTFFL